jgi:hypothetical protein
LQWRDQQGCGHERKTCAVAGGRHDIILDATDRRDDRRYVLRAGAATL